MANKEKAEKKSTDLVPSDEAKELLASLIGGVEIDSIKLLHAGSGLMQIGAEEGSPTTQEVEGIIVSAEMFRINWGPEENPDEPLCQSRDRVSGSNERTEIDDKPVFGDCKTCFYSQFGSDPKTKRGMMCKEKCDLYFLLTGTYVPYRLTVPSSSLRALARLNTALMNNGLRQGQVVVKVKSTNKTSPTDSSIKYTVLTFTSVRELEQEEIEGIVEPVSVHVKKYLDARPDFSAERTDF